ncbi:hypothetical protein NEUTE2DRAFT_136969 [Neurospora tetrasperma FGSC 2509]|nr:hypothetical protein NEUTE2DRAFT_136969 [Neurospora tetrasperma FGSC 2509]
MPIRRPGSPEPPAPADEAVMTGSQEDPQKKEEEKVFRVQGKEENEKEKKERKGRGKKTRRRRGFQTPREYGSCQLHGSGTNGTIDTCIVPIFIWRGKHMPDPWERAGIWMGLIQIPPKFPLNVPKRRAVCPEAKVRPSLPNPPSFIIFAFFLFAYLALCADRKLTALFPRDAAKKEEERRKKREETARKLIEDEQKRQEFLKEVRKKMQAKIDKEKEEEAAKNKSK